MSRSTRYLSRGYVRFWLNRAAQAHKAGKPHRAWEIVDQAGLGDHYHAFLRVGLRQARREYLARMP